MVESPRLTVKVSFSPACVPTMRCMSVKLSILVPSMSVTMSPTWNPAAAAALLASILSTRAVVLGLPKKVKRQVKITTANTKLAIGPAATIAARGPTFLWWKLPARSSSVMLESASAEGVEASVSSPKNLT